MDAGRTVVVPREAGVELAVWVADASGSDEAAGLPVLLLHGLSQQRWFWGPVQGRMRSAPVAAVDQRGHGDCDTPTDADYSVRACAADAIAVLDALGWDRAVIAGHSWGASVALAAGAAHPDRAAAVALIDGGLWALGALGPRDRIRDQLTPPPLDLPPDRLWALIRAGDLGPTWSAETQSALAPTFTTNSDGALVSRLGLERHMRVLDGLLDYDPEPDLASCSAAGTPVWAVVCAPEGGVAPLWSDARSAGVAAADRMGVRVHRWGGAVHDVPLQWPALVAGFVDALAETVGSRTDGRPGSKGREGR